MYFTFGFICQKEKREKMVCPINGKSVDLIPFLKNEIFYTKKKKEHMLQGEK
jgi:hypothetical protein